MRNFLTLGMIAAAPLMLAACGETSDGANNAVPAVDANVAADANATEAAMAAPEATNNGSEHTGGPDKK